MLLTISHYVLIINIFIILFFEGNFWETTKLCFFKNKFRMCFKKYTFMKMILKICRFFCNFFQVLPLYTKIPFQIFDLYIWKTPFSHKKLHKIYLYYQNISELLLHQTLGNLRLWNNFKSVDQKMSDYFTQKIN